MLTSSGAATCSTSTTLTGRAMALSRITLLGCLLLKAASLMAAPEVVADDDQVVAIQTVLGQVRDALVGIQTTLSRDNYPLLASVTLTLQTTVAKEVGGQLKLWVITIGKKWEKSKSQEVVIQLTPPSPSSPRSPRTENLTAALESTIVSAVEGAQNAGTQESPLTLTGLQASISFAVKKGAGGGAAVELIPVGADFSGDISTTAVQNIRVVFGVVK
jgi:hypothetical protein